LTNLELQALLARIAATESGLDPALVCAVCENESSWDPDALRLEQGFYRRYIQSMKGLSLREKVLRSVSFGLMQVMGQVARELGFSDPDLSQCAEPRTNLTLGCRRLKRALEKHDGNTRAALLDYNGGADLGYPERVLARMPKYRKDSV
jgi:soluble lytic murein transglycosylase-like protein